MIERVETETFIEVLRVLRDQGPAANTLELRMIENGLDQTLAQSPAAKGFEDDDVGQIRISRVISDGAGEPDLLLAPVNAKGQRIANGLAHHLARARAAPVRLLQNVANLLEVEQGGIGADGKLLNLNARHRHGRGSRFAWIG